MIKNRTWDLVPPNPTHNLVTCRWFFTTKYLPSGKEIRRKGRLVAHGFNQRYGVDYAETFRPVIKSTSIRTYIDIAVKKNWNINELAINNVLLQGHLNEEVYMTQPPGFVDKDTPHHVCKLNRPIYGLKQVPRAWYQYLKQHLLNGGLIYYGFYPLLAMVYRCFKIYLMRCRVYLERLQVQGRFGVKW